MPSLENGPVPPPPEKKKPDRKRPRSSSDEKDDDGEIPGKRPREDEEDDFYDRGAYMEGEIPVFSCMDITETVSSKLKYDIYFNEYIVVLEKEPTTSKGISLDIPQADNLIQSGRRLSDAILRRGGSLTSEKKIHLGGMVYLTYAVYEGQGIYGIRQYCTIEGEDVATKRGISLRQGNFDRILRAILRQIAMVDQLEESNEELISSVIDLVLKKRILQRARRDCPACGLFLPMGKAQHKNVMNGCMAEWGITVQRQFSRSIFTKDLEKEAEQVYNQILRDSAAGFYNGLVPHAFEHLYKETITQDDSAVVDLIATLLPPVKEQSTRLQLVCQALGIEQCDLAHFGDED